MRRSYFDVGFIKSFEGKTQGISLGYDRCGEHERGIFGLREAFGVPIPEFPQGLIDRTVTELPPTLIFKLYAAKPIGYRRRKEIPAAILLLETWAQEETTLEKFIRLNAVEFNRIDFKGGADAEKGEIAASWDRESFAINVYGEDNILRLLEIYKAFTEKDIAVGTPRIRTNLLGGLNFIIASRMPLQDKQVLHDNDNSFRKMRQESN